jgi:hypothetical protein
LKSLRWEGAPVFANFGFESEADLAGAFRDVSFVPIADINHHLFSAVACVKASYVYEQEIWLQGTPG